MRADNCFWACNFKEIENCHVSFRWNFPKFVEQLFAENLWDAHCAKRARIQADLLCKSPYSICMRENTDQKNSKYGHFLRSDYFYLTH